MNKILSFLTLMVASFSLAQTTTTVGSSTSASKWTFGGSANVGFSSGNYGSGTTISLAPRVGYKLTENFEVGGVGSFTWGSSKYFSTTMFSIGPFANYYFSKQFYISGQFQQYFYNQKDKYYGYKYSDEESALYFGAGYMQRVGNNAYMQIGAMYNVLYKEGESIFSSGFIPTVGFVIGL